jgi:hypothetical protein
MMTYVDTVQVFKKLIELGFLQTTNNSKAKSFFSETQGIIFTMDENRISSCEFLKFEFDSWETKLKLTNTSKKEVYYYIIAIFGIVVGISEAVLKFEDYYNMTYE